MGAGNALRGPRLFQAFSVIVLLCFLTIPGHTAPGTGDSSPPLLWWDGSWSPGEQSPGKLLSGNPCFWGAAAETGVTYSYDDPECEQQDPKHQMLIDGRAQNSNFSSPSLLISKPVRVLFDFQNPCGFREVDLMLNIIPNQNRLGVLVEVADSPAGPWQLVHDYPPAGGPPGLMVRTPNPYNTLPPATLMRIPLEKQVSARFLRLTLEPADGSGKPVRLQEAFVFGEAQDRVMGRNGVPPGLKAGASSVTPAHREKLPLLDGVPGDLSGLEPLEFKPLLGSPKDETEVEGKSKTRAWMAWYPTGLYVVVECQETGMANRVTDASAPWANDTLELMINPSYRQGSDRFWHVGITSDGKIWEESDRIMDPTATGKPFRLIGAVRREANKWTAEILLPLEVISGKETVLQDWSIQLCRSRNVRSEKGDIVTSNSCWPDIRSATWKNPFLFGTVRLRSEELSAGQIQILPGMPSSSVPRSDLAAWSDQVREVTTPTKPDRSLWQRLFGSKPSATSSDVAWNVVPDWKHPMQVDKLPTPGTMNQPVRMLLTRNETEGVPIVLRNLNLDAITELRPTLAGFPSGAKLEGRIAVAGALWTLRYGCILSPLFAEGNLLNPGRLDKYLTNARQIADFPALHLGPGEAVLLWLKITASDTPAGIYSARLELGAGHPSIPIEVEVLAAELPRPRLFVRSWGQPTRMLPFTTEARLKNEISSMLDSGYRLFNENDSDAGVTPAQVQWSPFRRASFQIARQINKQSFCLSMCPGYIPPEIRKDRAKGQALLQDPTFQEGLRQRVKNLVSMATLHGLDYADWVVELWDEPGIAGENDYLLYADMARMIKAADPKVRISCNPYLRVRDASGNLRIASPGEALKLLQETEYSKWCDVSIPIEWMADIPELHSQLAGAKRDYNLYYVHPCPGRKMPWKAFTMGANGWGYYSYFRGPDACIDSDPWTDFDEGSGGSDYLVVYPGPQGAVPTFLSEEMREGYDDFCLLTLLKEKGLQAEVETLLKDTTPLTHRRQRAMELLRTAITR